MWRLCALCIQLTRDVIAAGRRDVRQRLPSGRIACRTARLRTPSRPTSGSLHRWSGHDELRQQRRRLVRHTILPQLGASVVQAAAYTDSFSHAACEASMSPSSDLVVYRRTVCLGRRLASRATFSDGPGRSPSHVAEHRKVPHSSACTADDPIQPL